MSVSFRGLAVVLETLLEFGVALFSRFPAPSVADIMFQTTRLDPSEVVRKNVNVDLEWGREIGRGIEERGKVRLNVEFEQCTVDLY